MIEQIMWDKEGVGCSSALGWEVGLEMRNNVWWCVRNEVLWEVREEVRKVSEELNVQQETEDD